MWAQRELVGEIMDDPALAAQPHCAALRGLARINWVSRTPAVLWARIERVLAAGRATDASLLDVACGGGDVAVALARRARRRGYPLRVQGCDVSDVALQYALRQGAREGVEFFRTDVVEQPLPRHYTFITCTLFLHHLTEARIVRLLRALAGACDYLLVSDLIRNRPGYALAWAGTKLLSRSPVVHEDGLRSVRAALTVTEAQALALAAGLVGARFERQWPQRFLMSWSRAGGVDHGAR